MNRKGFNRQPEADAEAGKDFWSIQGDFTYSHHIEPRVPLYVPKEETFLIPLKYTGVTRATRTDLDIQIPGNRTTGRNLRTRLVQGNMYGQRLQEWSFKT